MTSYTVHAKVYGFPQSIPDVVDKVQAALIADGWQVISFGVGDTSGLFPTSIDAHFVVSRLGATEATAILAVQKACGGGFFSAWSDWSAAAADQLVAQSAKDFSTTAARTGAALEKGAGGIGIGIGAVLGCVALAAGAFLVWRFVPRGGG